MNKNTIIGVLVVVLIVVGAFALFNRAPQDTNEPVTNEPTEQPATSTEPTVQEGPTTVIGKSVEGRDITAYNYGSGDKRVLFVGGIHGGYSWNTSLVAYEAMEYFEKNPSAIPANVKVTVIPVVNPDGLSKVVSATGEFSAGDVKASQSVQVSGRFNAHTVDLNRNFDCQWQATGQWQNRSVSGGTAAFSEPETLAIKNYIDSRDPAGVVIMLQTAAAASSLTLRA
jgi:murein tripeptide amidase MpaA